MRLDALLERQYELISMFENRHSGLSSSDNEDGGGGGGKDRGTYGDGGKFNANGPMGEGLGLRGFQV